MALPGMRAGFSLLPGGFNAFGPGGSSVFPHPALNYNGGGAMMGGGYSGIGATGPAGQAPQGPGVVGDPRGPIGPIAPFDPNNPARRIAAPGSPIVDRPIAQPNLNLQNLLPILRQMNLGGLGGATPQLGIG